MAYNRNNILQRIVTIQEITLKHTSNGVSQEFVYENVISKTFFISRSTYYRYLAQNAKHELKKYEKTRL